MISHFYYFIYHFFYSKYLKNVISGCEKIVKISLFFYSRKDLKVCLQSRTRWPFDMREFGMLRWLWM